MVLWEVMRVQSHFPLGNLGKGGWEDLLLSSLTTWTGVHSQLSAFLEEYDIRTQVSAVVELKYRTSKPEPSTRQQFLQCKCDSSPPGY